MTIEQILVTIGGIGTAIWVAWYFWFSEKKGVKIQAAASGTQEAFITVKGGYTPDVLIFEAGKPIKLNFHREETAACSEQVIFDDFQKQAMLTTNKTIPIELKIDKPGEYEFHCAMGMLRGKLIVK